MLQTLFLILPVPEVLVSITKPQPCLLVTNKSLSLQFVWFCLIFTHICHGTFILIDIVNFCLCWLTNYFGIFRIGEIFEAWNRIHCLFKFWKPRDRSWLSLQFLAEPPLSSIFGLTEHTPLFLWEFWKIRSRSENSPKLSLPSQH